MRWDELAKAAVIPAKAGIQWRSNLLRSQDCFVIPAFAAMTSSM